MIHLNNLSMAVSLLNERAQSESAQAAHEHVVATPASEPDPENPPVIWPGPHHFPGLPLPPVASLARIADTLSAVAINPQPLPPKESPAGIANALAAVALNPQPLPPKEALEDLNRSPLAGRIG